MGAEGLRRQANMTNHIESRGEDSEVNGQTIIALWQDAGAERIQNFLREGEWGTESFEVRMPYYASGPSFLVKNGVEMTRYGENWTGVVRGMTPERSDNEIIQWNALCVLTTK
jgi:hypothetical protein